MPSWFDTTWIEAHRRRLTAAVEKAAEILAQRMIEKVSADGPAHGEPGEPPHVEHDILRATITSQVAIVDDNQITAKVGSPAPEAFLTETGTSKMAPRPWCASTLAENLQEIEATIVRG